MSDENNAPLVSRQYKWNKFMGQEGQRVWEDLTSKVDKDLEAFLIKFYKDSPGALITQESVNDLIEKWAVWYSKVLLQIVNKLCVPLDTLSVNAEALEKIVRKVPESEYGKH